MHHKNIEKITRIINAIKNTILNDERQEVTWAINTELALADEKTENSVIMFHYIKMMEKIGIKLDTAILCLYNDLIVDDVIKKILNLNNMEKNKHH